MTPFLFTSYVAKLYIHVNLYIILQRLSASGLLFHKTFHTLFTQLCHEVPGMDSDATPVTHAYDGTYTKATMLVSCMATRIILRTLFKR